MFRIEGRRVGAPGGDLRPLEPLDYENPDHRKGFRFRVEVTDMGEEGWEDKYHVDGTWVNLQVADANDNPPVFTTHHAHLTLPEDTPAGTHLTTFTAHDLDGGGYSRIRYSIAPTSDPDGRFSVDGSGAVRLAGGLDREAAATHNLLVRATDDGVPPRTATATLSVNVTDVNDNPPFLAEPREVRVVENGGRQEVARVTLDDPDDWRLGHGPPFTLALDPRAPPHVSATVMVTHDKRGDEGRGVGVVSTLAPLDREEGRQLLVPLVVTDAGSLSATVTLTIHVTDLNDNPMTPAAKTVTVHTLQPQVTPVPLGRVYVQDPDDWASSSKTYAWRRHQRGFFLDTSTGDLTMAASTPDGRYELAFLVNDVSQGQSGVMANVTVEVKSLTPRDVTQATLLTLAADPYKVVRQENKGGTSLLRRLVVASQAWVEGKATGVQAWVDDDGTGTWAAEGGAGVGAAATSGKPKQEEKEGQKTTPPTTHVWVSAPGVHNLNHILLYRRRELARALRVTIQDVGAAICPETSYDATLKPTNETSSCEGGCWARAVLGRGYSVVDARNTAVVGPRLEIRRGCGCLGPTNPPEDRACGPDTCLNGGRCVPTPTGTRCICPYGTWGSRCKVLSRYFEGGGVGEADPGGGTNPDSGAWVWAPPVPTCAEVHLSLEILTASGDATLLYSGPLWEEGTSGVASDTEESQVKGEDVEEGDTRRTNNVDDGSVGSSDVAGGALQGASQVTEGAARGTSDVLLLELRGGRPSLLLDLGAGAVTLSLNASYSLADDTWHRIDLIWKDELVEMIVDLCSGTSLDTPPTPPSNPAPPDAHTCRGAAGLPRAARVLNTARPLQIGGLAHPPPAHTHYGWPAPLRPRPLRGCLRNLRINGQLADLGEGLLSRRSYPGCPAADCLSTGLHCGLHGRCHGSPGSLRCECQPGWAGPGCTTPTTPTSFLVNSYIKLALSFTPLGYTTTITLRLRTRTPRGQLVVLSSRGGRDHLALQLVNGRLCVLLQFQPDPARSLCLTRAQVTDGQWHTVVAARHGSATFLTVDDGDGGDLYNASVSLEGRQLLEVDGEEGVSVGGSPQIASANVIQIHGDYHDGCIDDLRISGRSVPLPPEVNSTAWGEVSVFKGVEPGCAAPPACTNVTCRAPFSCIDTWRSYNCGCGEGRVLSSARTTCEDEDECVWQPCLNGGSCFNKHSAGYVCACPVGFSGQHCQLPDARETSLKLSLGALVAILVWCAFLLLLICAFLLHQHHKRSALRRGMTAEVKDNSVKEQSSSPSSHTPNLLELQLLQPPRANGQPAWTTVNPNIADVDVLQVDAASVTSSVEDQKRCSTSAPDAGPPRAGGGRSGESPLRKKSGASLGGAAGVPAAGDDLRNYAYEGEGSSPGSLSSCLESCSGSAKFLGGFREVAHILES
ncbi:putative neural-cadherin 2 isoform X1 [Panulirus ornatus]|uniref:putative neural-cadherin 2 isoform X1 n=1 Tax=Panulirus ornatus TaxID=150431 RepID=UPI003A87FBA6